MKTLFVLISHELTAAQREDAVATFGIDRFVVLPTYQWSQIPAEEEDISGFLEELKVTLGENTDAGDLLLVQGDFGATCHMVQYARSIGLVPVYSTTRRVSRDIVEGKKTITIREFEHVRFRVY